MADLNLEPMLVAKEVDLELVVDRPQSLEAVAVPVKVQLVSKHTEDTLHHSQQVKVADLVPPEVEEQRGKTTGTEQHHNRKTHTSHFECR